MGEAPRVRYGEGVLRVPAERRPRHDRHPVGGVVQLCRAGVALAATGLEDAVSGVIPGEETRVDHDRGNRSRRAEADQRPVVSGLPAPPGLPAIDDLSAVAVLARLEDRWAGFSRFSLSPNDSSLAATTLPPSHREARSTAVFTGAPSPAITVSSRPGAALPAPALHSLRLAAGRAPARAASR